MSKINWRYDEFTDEDEAVLIEGESAVVPSVGKPYVSLAELPREDSPSTVSVVAAGAGSTQTPSEDSYIYEGNPSTNYGSSGILVAGKDDAGHYHSLLYRSLLKWNLAGLPSVVSSCKLRIYREFGHNNPTFVLCRVTSAWSAGSVTWGTRPTFNAVPESSVNVSQQPGWYEFDLTALFNEWQAGTTPNNGVQLGGNEIDTDTVSNWTSLNGTSGYQPYLRMVTAGNKLLEVPYNVVPVSGEFAIHYGTGRLRFPATDAGSTFNVDYMATGGPIDAYD